MSSYIVNDETINKVVSYLCSKANGPDPNILWNKTKLEAMGFDLRSQESCAKLAHKMFDLNVAAVQARYGEAEGEGFPLPVFAYSFMAATTIEVIKALKAWLYQCTEGRVPQSALYLAMTEVHCLLCIDFVEQTEEYEATPWG